MLHGQGDKPKLQWGKKLKEKKKKSKSRKEGRREHQASRSARRYLILPSRLQAQSAAEPVLPSCHPHSQQKPPPCELQGSMENMNLISGSVFLKSAQFQ